MQVVIDGKAVKLQDKDILGHGGEGVVYSHKGMAVKVYHQPANAQEQIRNERRGRKLKDMVGVWPGKVIAPEKLVLDPATRAPIGFSMKLVPQPSQEVYFLSDRDKRKMAGADLPNLLNLSSDLCGTLDEIHGRNVVVGDLNDLGLMFTPSWEAFWIDADSFQTTKWPCIVAQPAFLDPSLYGVNLDDGKFHFTKETDYYALAVVLFKSLLIVHPFGGIHKTMNDIPPRAEAGISVLDGSVRYPRWAPSPETLSDDMLHAFMDIFTRKKRYALTDMIGKEREQSRECPTCHYWHSSQRSNCPSCSAMIAAPRPKSVATAGGIVYTQWFRTDGSIIFAQQISPTEFAWIETTKDGTWLHRRIGGILNRPPMQISKRPMTGVSFAATANYLFAAKDGRIESLRTDGSSPEPSASVDAGMYGQDPTMATGAGNLYRAFGQHMVQEDYSASAKQHVSRVIGSVMENQTRIWAGMDGTLVVMMRYFNETAWMIWRQGSRCKMEVMALSANERLVDASVAMDEEKGTIGLWRKYIDAGKKQVVSQEIFDMRDGRLVRYSDSRNGADYLSGIHGRAILHGSVFHPTDNGLVLDENSKVQKRIGDTEKFIDAQSRLFVYNRGLVVVTGNTVGDLHA